MTRSGILRPFTLTVLCLQAAPLHAVVIRHDKSDADAVALGRRFTAAGRVLPNGGCTLIAPSWAVTAAHVAARLRPGSRVEFERTPQIVKRVIAHPDATGPAGAPPEVDLALIEFVAPVAGVQPVALNKSRDELGKAAFIVGYGDYGVARAPFQRTDGKRRAVTNAIDDAGPKRIFMPGTYGVVDVYTRISSYVDWIEHTIAG